MLLNRVYPMFYIYKCSKQEGESHLHSPIISPPGEMYLNLAECLRQEGWLCQCCKFNLNVIREAFVTGQGYTSLNASNAAKLIDKENNWACLRSRTQRARALMYTVTEEHWRHYPGPHNAMEEIKATDTRVVQFIPQRSDQCLRKH